MSDHDERSGDSDMGQRGVTRMQHGGGGDDSLSRDERHRMMLEHHRQTLWIPWTLILLGLWVLLAPLTFEYSSADAMPSGGREVWLGSLEMRRAVTKWNDIVCGALLVLLGWRSLKPGAAIARWAACLVGVWLTFAPILFWSPSAAAYMSDTLVGMWVIALTILIPGMPRMLMYMKMGGAVPKGWTYNPSSWAQRWILIALGFVGLVVSRYLTAYQLGYIDQVWDPFFGPQSAAVLDSAMSHMWPISDAGLGAFAYTLEFLMGFMGSPKRWRTMPWMVTLYGFLVIPLGAVHILLVISQPILVGAWCTLCLLAAVIMLPMLPLEGDEVVAMGQHLVRARRRGASLWRTFWKGAEPEGATEDERSPDLGAMHDHPVRVLKASVWGFSVPWTLAAASLLALAVVFVPGWLNLDRLASNVFHLTGLLVIATAVVAMGEVFRLLRYLIVPLGLALAVLTLVLQAPVLAIVIAVAAGLALAALALPKGPQREHYGRWDRFVR